MSFTAIYHLIFFQNSQFSYDAFGQNAQILEYVSGSLTSTKIFVWDGGDRAEARNAGGTITAQYFARGETISGSSYYWTADHLGSIREITNSSGTVQSQLSYDPFGRPITLQASTLPDFEYADYYMHAPSGFGLTRTRAYDCIIGRFISRDTVGEKAGINLFAYVLNRPINASDPPGTDYYVTYGQNAGWGGDAHKQLCVDTWVGCCGQPGSHKQGRYCISFGNTLGGYPFGPGKWYQDLTENENNPIFQNYYTHTNCSQDRKILRFLQNLTVEPPSSYSLLGFNNSIFMPIALYYALPAFSSSASWP